MSINKTFEVLHLYYKLAYIMIKIQWGGPEDQAAQFEAGDPNVKDWQDEAQKIVEKTISRSLHLHKIMKLTMWN